MVLHRHQQIGLMSRIVGTVVEPRLTQTPFFEESGSLRSFRYSCRSAAIGSMAAARPAGVHRR